MVARNIEVRVYEEDFSRYNNNKVFKEMKTRKKHCNNKFIC
jgi:hypothetical protein